MAAPTGQTHDSAPDRNRHHANSTLDAGAPSTHDPKDTQVIFHMLRIGATQTYCDPLHSGIQDDLEVQNRAVASALTHCLPLNLPGVARFAGNSRSNWCPTPASITAFSRGDFVSAARDVVGKKLSTATGR
jgi:hypothetical protein